MQPWCGISNAQKALSPASKHTLSSVQLAYRGWPERQKYLYQPAQLETYPL